MYRVKQLETSVDLSGFSIWLREQQVGHRITEEGAQQVLWLEDPAHTEPVLAALEKYLNEPAVQAAVNASSRSPVFVGGRWQPSPRHAPLVLAIIIVAVVVALVTGLGQNLWSTTLMIIDPRHYPWDSFDDKVLALRSTLSAGQFWRLFTPDLLHFSWPHIIFNAVMFWFLGSQVEWFDGRVRLVSLLLVASLASNGLQYFVSGPLFGGLSGVVYGLLGYCWLSQRRQARFQFPAALVIVSVVWMLIGFTSLMGSMANEAHLGGFIAGLAMALILAPPKKAPPVGGA